MPHDQCAGAPAENLLETKILLNSVTSDAHQRDRFMSVDIKDNFFATPIQNPEFMRVKHEHLPNYIRTYCNLDSKATHNDYVCIKSKKGMPSLKQAATLVHDRLFVSLEPCGHEPIPATMGLWRHKTMPTKFCLYADDFGVKH